MLTVMDREAWNARYSQKELVWTAEANRFLVQEVESLPPGHALDVAAGEGRNAVWLAERGWRVHAIDFADLGLAKGRKLAEARGVEVAFEQQDLREYTPRAAGYDLVLVFYLHLPWHELLPIVKKCEAAVAPGGTFLLVGHDLENLEHGHGGPPSASVLYTARQIADALDDLEIEKAERVERVVKTDDGDATALDCLVRARRPK